MKTSKSSLVLLGCLVGSAMAGQCMFHQTCLSDPDNPTDCIPTMIMPGEDNSSFPMDEAHNFSIPYIDPSGKLVDPAPIVCPQYKDDGCCTWQSNVALYTNFQTMVNSFYVNGGCLACSVNLVNWWCGIVCSPNQADFVTIADPPYAYHQDNMGDGDRYCLQANVVLNTDYACDLYDSCKSTAIASQVSAMSSALGFLNYQGQDGAIHNGNEYFILSFAGEKTDDDDNTDNAEIAEVAEVAEVAADDDDDDDDGDQSTGFSYPLLACDDFKYPGSEYPPYPYPPPEDTETMSCSCGSCHAACASGATVSMDTSSNPIDPLDGFQSEIVFPVYAVLFLVGVGLWWKSRPPKMPDNSVENGKL